MHIAGDHKHVNGDRILFKDAVYVYRGNKWKVDRSAEATRMLGQNFHWVGTGAATGIGGIPFPVSRIGHRDARLTTGGKGLLIGGDNMASAVIMRSNGNFTLDKNGQLVPFKRDPKKRNLPRYFYAQSESAQNQLNISREKADTLRKEDFIKEKAGNLRLKQGLIKWSDKRIINYYNTNLKRGVDPTTNEALKLILKERGLDEDPSKPGNFLTRTDVINRASVGSGKGQDENNAGQVKGDQTVTNADIPVFSELKGAEGTEYAGKNLRNQPNLKVTRTEPDGRGGTREVTYMTHQPQKGPIPRNRNKLAVTQIPETWARGQGRKLKDVNRDTALALQSQGWDLKGIPKSDLRRLYADFRTGRAVVFEKPDGKYLHYNGKVYHNSNTGEISVGKDDQLRINKPQNRVNPLNIPGPTGDFRVPDQTYA